MDNPENSLILASTRALPIFEFNISAKEAKARALEKSALIARVTDRDSKVLAVRAQEELKRQLNAIEKARKQLKEPLLNAGRQLDTLCAAESLELDKEFGRVSAAVKEFDDAERRRVAEEERLQRLELDRIEREKQAELKRIADEQARIDREAKEAQEAAARAAREATNEKERAAAAAKVANAEASRKAAEQSATANAEKVRQVEDTAAAAAYVEGRPIQITRVEGQVSRNVWNITFVDVFELARHRPDLVNITPRTAEIKAALAAGQTIRGVKAELETKPDVRVGKDKSLIEV
jgi:hypothetical protein